MGERSSLPLTEGVPGFRGVWEENGIMESFLRLTVGGKGRKEAITGRPGPGQEAFTMTALRA